MSREQLDTLLNEACSLAIYLLEKNREFFPFAVALGKHGDVRHSEGYTGSEQPPSAEVIDLLEAGLAADARTGEIVACAIVKDVRLTLPGTQTKTDAVEISLEHRVDDPVVCFLPYSFEGSAVTTQDILAQRGERRVFPDGAA